MKVPRLSLGEMLVGIAFAGLAAFVVAGAWDSPFVLHGLAISGTVLVPGFLVALLMVRQHREKGKRTGPGRPAGGA
jgi:hypothetical protein